MAAIKTSQTAFSANEQITSGKLNNILLQSSFDTGAVTGDGTIVLISGQMQIGAVKAANIPSSIITVDKIYDGAVTPVKLSLGRINWTDWTTDASKISTTVLAYGRTTGQSGTTNFDFRSSDATINTSYDARISRASGAVGSLSIDNVYDPADTTTTTRGQIDFKINGVNKLSIRQDGVILSGSSPIYGLKSWGTVDGKTASLTITGTATRAGTLVTCIGMTAHGFVTNDIVYVEFGTTAILSGIYLITRIDNDSFSLTTTATGAVTTIAAVITKRPFFGSNIKAVTGGKLASDKGTFAVTFETAMSSVNYSITGSAKTHYPNFRGNSLFSLGNGIGYNAKTVNGFGFNICEANGTNVAYDSPEMNFQIVG